ncbi:MAG: hypothetical protein FWG45_02065 [Oscillospiraceae bacterium]|nr:hypothetical protein [Oscillospiraceae bacterium]
MKRKVLALFTAAAIIAATLTTAASPQEEVGFVAYDDDHACDVSDCYICVPFGAGDVDGDGEITLRDAFFVLHYIVNFSGYTSAPNPIKPPSEDESYPGNNSYHAVAGYFPEVTVKPSMAQAVMILRGLVGIAPDSNNPDFAFDLPFGYGAEVNLDKVYCRAYGVAVYKLAQDIPEDTLFNVKNTSKNTDDLIGLERAYEEKIWFRYDGFIDDETLVRYKNNNAITTEEATIINSSEHFVIGYSFEPLTKGAAVYIQSYPSTNSLPYCKELCCGGEYGLGRVTNSSKEPSMADALAILRYTTGLSSPLDNDPDAWRALGLEPFSEIEPGMTDALQILRHVVKLKTNSLTYFWG